MAGYIGSKASVTQVDGYNRTGADAEFVNDPNSVITVSGSNVGIGTSSPAYQLSIGRDDNGIYSDGDGMYIVQNTSNFDVLSLQSTGVVEYRSDDDDNSSTTGHIFYTDGSERMRIDSSGNLLVGTTTVGYTSQKGVTINGISSASYTSISHANGVASGNSYMLFSYNGGIIGSITQSGTTSVAYNTSSDYRLKEDVQPMTGASDRVLALNPVNFAWKSSGERVDGFLAHEAQTVVPEAVTGTKDAVDADGNPDYQGIDQSKLVPLLTAALQEALTEIADLKARVTALETV